MKKILSIILTIFFISSGLSVSSISLTEDNNSINEKQILYNTGKIYGFIKYSNGSNVFNSTVLLWESFPWGFSNMPDYITNTDSNGYYEFENLSYGRYHINPGKIGFKIGEKNVILNEENPEQRVDFTALNGKIYHQSLIIILIILFFIITK